MLLGLLAAFASCREPASTRDAAASHDAGRAEALASREPLEPPPVRPVPGVRLVVRADHVGAGGRRRAESDPAVRLHVEHAGGSTRIATVGPALPLRSADSWHALAPAAAWLEVAEGAAVDERVSLRAGPAGLDVLVDGAAPAKLVVTMPGDSLLAEALAPVVALSLGGVDAAAVRSAIPALRAWEVRWPGRPPVVWSVESERREEMLPPERPMRDEVPAPLRLLAGAAQGADALSRRLRGGAVDDAVSLTVRNEAGRTLLVYVRGELVGWVAPSGVGRFLGIPRGRHPLFATSLRGTVVLRAVVAVPGDWTAQTGSSAAAR